MINVILSGLILGLSSAFIAKFYFGLNIYSIEYWIIWALLVGSMVIVMIALYLAEKRLKRWKN